MYLGLDTGVLHQHTGIGSEATAGTSNVPVNLKDFLNTAGDHQRRGDPLLDSQENAILRLDTDGSGPELWGQIKSMLCDPNG